MERLMVVTGCGGPWPVLGTDADRMGRMRHDDGPRHVCGPDTPPANGGRLVFGPSSRPASFCKAALAGCVFLAVGAAAQAQELKVNIDERTGALTASYDGTPIIRMEALQVIDTTGGWNVVYANGKSGEVRISHKGVGDGKEVLVEEQLANVIKAAKRVAIAGDSLSVSLDYQVAPDVPATMNYYFLDIPQASVEGAVCTTGTEGRELAGILRPGAPSGAVATGITHCSILGPAAELDFELEAENAEWRFADWTNTEHQSYRLRVERPIEEDGFAVHLGFTMTVKPSNPEQVAAEAARLEQERKERMKERLAALRMTERKPLAIHSVKASADSVPVYEKLELTVDLTGTWDNPFDPEQIDVQGHFTGPDGATTAVPGFLYQAHEHTEEGEKPNEAPVWKVRFAPMQEGRHEYRVTARDGTGEATSDRGSFVATEAESDGFVRIAERAPLYCQFDSGEPYFAIGTNHFTSMRLGQPLPADRLPAMARYLTGLADNGANYARLRMDSWWLAIEGPPDDATGYLGVGKFHLPTAWIVDRLFELAHERDCTIQLCLYNPNGHINNPREDWRKVYNFFVKEQGGPLDDIGDFWTDPETARLVKNKLRYVVARWGYSRNLMAWEFFNEVVIRRETADAITAWHDEMSTYLRSIDPWQHLITTSPMGGSFGVSAGLWALPNMDIVQVHSYEFTDMGAGLPRFCREPIEEHGKPFIAGEFGLPRRVLEAGGHRLDADGLHLHNGLWSSALSGSAGTAMHWYITSYIDPNGLYRHFRGLSAFMPNVPILSRDLRPVETRGFRYITPPTPEKFSDVTLVGRPVFRRSEVNRFAVGRDGHINDPGELNGYLWGVGAHQDLRNPPTFIVDFRQPGEFVVHVDMVVGNGDNPIHVYLDNQLVLEENLPAGEGLGEKSEPVPQYDNWHTTYNQDLEIDVPAGSHEIRAECLGKDRTEVSYRLVGYVSNRDVVPLRVVGLSNGEGAYLWLQNQRSTFQALRDAVECEPAPATELDIVGLGDGTYSVEFWDTAEGKVFAEAEARAEDGVLKLELPEIENDIACIARREP